MMFRSVSIWVVGVAAMGVVLITFLNGSGVTASTAQGWQVSIGNQQPISVNAKSIGTALSKGSSGWKRVSMHLATYTNERIQFAA